MLRGQGSVGVVALDALRRVGLQAILEEIPGVVSRATTIEEALTSGDLTAVLLDSGCVPDVVDALTRFRRKRPAPKVLVLGEGLSAEQIETVMSAGARGYLSAAAGEKEIRAAMETVLSGLLWAPRKVLAKMIESGVTVEISAATKRCSDGMTQREIELLKLLKDGQTNRQIATAMGIELVTVKAHLGRMLRKCGVKNRIELTLKALAEGV